MRKRLSYRRAKKGIAFQLTKMLALGLRPSCSDEYEVPFAELPRDDCMVAPCFGLGLVFV